MRKRTSYPAVYYLENIPKICAILYSQPALPLKAIGAQRDRDKHISNDKYRNFIEKWLTAIYIKKEEYIPLLQIFSLLKDRDFEEKDFSSKISNVELRKILGDYVPRTVQTLTPEGRLLAEYYITKDYEKMKIFLFSLLFKKETNEKIPDYFPKVLQNREFIGREVDIEQIMDALGISRFKGKIPPEPKAIIEWTKYFGINVSTRPILLLDEYRLLYYIFNMIILEVNSFLAQKGVFNEDMLFADIREYIMHEILLNNNFIRPDDVFLQIINREGIITFPGRMKFVGTGINGNSEMTIVRVKKPIAFVDYEFVREYTMKRMKVGQ